MSLLQLNPEVSAFQRKFINEVRRCDDMERRLRESLPTVLGKSLAPGVSFRFPGC